LAGVLLPDSGHLQEEDARRANRYGYTKHHPAEPLYTAVEAEHSLALFESVAYRQNFAIGNLTMHFTPAGHILGAACVQAGVGGRILVFSGDLGRQNDAVMHPPEPVVKADYLIVESTDGDRRHAEEDAKARLAAVVKKTVARGGLVMIPAFAVGRAQYLLHLLTQLRTAGDIPNIPFYLDSPMAIDVTEIFSRYQTELRLSKEQCQALCTATIYVRTPEESKKIAASATPKIIIAGAGMLTGGRILHHLRAFGPDHRNTLVFAGYQAEGTRGHALLNGASTLKIFGEEVRIVCHIESMAELSAHADYVEIGEWLAHFEAAPEAVFITHGEPIASDRLRQYIETRFGWNVVVPEMAQEFLLI
jgi:metallo-beta-lactamase family protein